MKSSGVLGTPGAFAAARFKDRHRLWKSRVRPWVFVAMLPTGLILLAASRIWPQQSGFYLGAAIGTFATAFVALLDGPPEHIDRWRRGADGERATARQLRPLAKTGWSLYHDVACSRGNIDHVAVGPTGVFLLDTKNLGGQAVIEDGVLRVAWLEDPDDGYACDRLANQMKGAAARLHRELREKTRVHVRVEPVVVVWAPFDQGAVSAEGVNYVHGSQVRSWLESRPTVMNRVAQELVMERWHPEVRGDQAGTSQSPAS